MVCQVAVTSGDPLHWLFVVPVERLGCVNSGQRRSGMEIAKHIKGMIMEKKCTVYSV